MGKTDFQFPTLTTGAVNTMIECPECNQNITGYRCACGYSIPKTRMDGYQNRKQRDKATDDKEHHQEAIKWLETQRITTPDMTKGERMKATAKYRQTVSNLPKPDPLDWARLIMSRMADGDFILPIQERMAKEALGVQ